MKNNDKEELLSYLCLDVNPEKAQEQKKKEYDYPGFHNHCISHSQSAIKFAWNEYNVFF